MILIKYIVRETFKNQIIILFGLLIILSCQNLIKILKSTIDGEIPGKLILILLELSIPIMVKFLLPFSLFLAILITLGKLHTFNEIIAMYTCRLSKSILLKAILILIFFSAFINTINVFWLSPYSSRCQEKILQEVKNNPNLIKFISGKFYTFNKKNIMFFIEEIKDNKFSNFLLTQLPPKEKSSFLVIIADSGYIKQCLNGTKEIILYKGKSYEGNPVYRTFRIKDFISYKLRIKYNPTVLNLNNSDQADMLALFKSANPKFKAELHWRFTIIFSVLVMALIVVPLSTINNQNRILYSTIPAILLYLFFFILQIFCKFNFGSRKFDLVIWMWIINGLYLLLAIIMNVWDTTTIRYIRSNLIKLGHHN